MERMTGIWRQLWHSKGNKMAFVAFTSGRVFTVWKQHNSRHLSTLLCCQSLSEIDEQTTAQSTGKTDTSRFCATITIRLTW